jgi:hypothetical protein
VAVAGTLVVGQPEVLAAVAMEPQGRAATVQQERLIQAAVEAVVVQVLVMGQLAELAALVL